MRLPRALLYVPSWLSVDVKPLTEMPLRLPARGLVILLGAAITGVIVSVLGYVGYALFVTCHFPQVCEVWDAMGFGMILGTIATPCGGVLTYRWTRPPSVPSKVREA